MPLLLGWSVGSDRDESFIARVSHFIARVLSSFEGRIDKLKNDENESDDPVTGSVFLELWNGFCG